MSVLFRWIFVASLMRMIGIALMMVAIFLIAESFDKTRFVGQSMTMSLLVEYLLLKIPFMISDFMPVIVLLASAIYITEISHHHELVAVRSSGIGLFVVLNPLLAAAAVAGLFTFAMSEWVEPMTNDRLAYMDREMIQNKRPLVNGEHVMVDANTSRGVQWLREGTQLLRLTPLTGNYFALMALKTDATGQWLQRIDANRAHYADGAWHLEQVVVSQPKEESGITIQSVDAYVLLSNITPETSAAPNPREMTWMELYRFSRDLANAGLASGEYVYQLHRKLASPLACLVMVILAYSLCANMGSRIAANSKGLVLAVLIGFLFYIFANTVYLLAGNIQLPMVFAAWWPNVLFAGLAGYLLLVKEGY